MKAFLFNFCFILLLLLPGVHWLQGVFFLEHSSEAISYSENRLKTPYPSDVSISERPKFFFQQLNTFFNDNLPSRNTLLSLNSLFHYYFFQMSSVEDVVLGKSSWLFYGNEEIEKSYRPLLPAWKEKQDIWHRVVQRKNELLGKDGKGYALVVAPNKHSIYPEYLINDRYLRIVPNRLDTFMESFRETPYNVIDLRSVLSEAKKEGPVYFKTDTHWNDLGSSVAAQHLLETFSLSSRREESAGAKVSVEKTGFNGDLAGIWGVEKWFKGETLRRVEKASCAEKPTPKHYKFKNNMNIELLEYRCAQGESRILLFADSFGRSLQKHLAGEVGTLYVAKQRPSYYEFNFLVEELKPDFVLELYVERILDFTSRKGTRLLPLEEGFTTVK